MKKIVYIFAALLFVSVKAAAQNPQLIIDDCVAPIGGQVVVAVKYNTEGGNYSGVNFNIDLPEGLTYELDSKGNIIATMDSSNSGFQAVTSSNGFAPFSASDCLAGKEGVLLSFVLNVASDLEKDQELTCTVRNIAFTSEAGNKVPLESFTFVVKISDMWILDENSVVVPAASDGEVNVLVKRTIVANQWSTICLPFDMTKEQVSAAFGDAQFAYFDSYTVDGNVPTKDAVENASSIEISFVSDNMSGGFYANYPYLIKTAEKISEFNVEGVVISPDEEAAVQDYFTGSGARKVTHGYFYGTLHAGQVIPANDLFLNNNKFYYSAGKTKIKGFRGFFELKDLSSALSSDTSVKIYVDGDATSVDGLNIKYAVDGVYDLSGRKIKLEDGDVTKLQKGVYIIDGKKVTIK